MAKKEKVQEINPVCPITESENGNIKRSFYDIKSSNKSRSFNKWG